MSDWTGNVVGGSEVEDDLLFGMSEGADSFSLSLNPLMNPSGFVSAPQIRPSPSSLDFSSKVKLYEGIGAAGNNSGNARVMNALGSRRSTILGNRGGRGGSGMESNAKPSSMNTAAPSVPEKSSSPTGPPPANATSSSSLKRPDVPAVAALPRPAQHPPSAEALHRIAEHVAPREVVVVEFAAPPVEPVTLFPAHEEPFGAAQSSSEIDSAAPATQTETETERQTERDTERVKTTSAADAAETEAQRETGTETVVVPALPLPLSAAESVAAEPSPSPRERERVSRSSLIPVRSARGASLSSSLPLSLRSPPGVEMRALSGGKPQPPSQPPSLGGEARASPSGPGARYTHSGLRPITQGAVSPSPSAAPLSSSSSAVQGRKAPSPSTAPSPAPLSSSVSVTASAHTTPYYKSPHNARALARSASSASPRPPLALSVSTTLSNTLSVPNTLPNTLSNPLQGVEDSPRSVSTPSSVSSNSTYSTLHTAGSASLFPPPNGATAAQAARRKSLLSSANADSASAFERESFVSHSAATAVALRFTSALHTAAAQGWPLEEVRRIAAREPSLVSAQDEQGRLPLHYAAAYAVHDKNPARGNIFTVNNVAVRDVDAAGLATLPTSGMSVTTTTSTTVLPSSCLPISEAVPASDEVLLFLLQQYPEGSRTMDASGKKSVDYYVTHCALPSLPTLVALWQTLIAQQGYAHLKEEYLLGYAITNQAAFPVIEALIERYPFAVREEDLFGKLPLHYAAASIAAFTAASLFPSHTAAPRDIAGERRLATSRAHSNNNSMSNISLKIHEARESAEKRSAAGLSPSLSHSKSFLFAPQGLLSSAATESGGSSAFLGRGVPLGVMSVVELLIAKYPRAVTRGDREGRVPLHYASASAAFGALLGFETVVPALQTALTEPSQVDAMTLSPAELLANPFLACCVALLQNTPQCLQNKDKDGKLPLHYAATLSRQGRDRDASNLRALLQVLDLFVAHYPQALAVADNRGFLPLHQALRTKAPKEVVLRLLPPHFGLLPNLRPLAHTHSRPRSLSHTDTQTQSPLPASTTAAVQEAQGALHYALLHGADEEVLRALLDAQPRLAAQRHHETLSLPLHTALSLQRSGRERERRLSLSLLTRLVDCHEDALRERDVKGRLPLHIAFYNLSLALGLQDREREREREGAEGERDRDGEREREREGEADAAQDAEIVKMLLARHGAALREHDAERQTPLSLLLAMLSQSIERDRERERDRDAPAPRERERRSAFGAQRDREREREREKERESPATRALQVLHELVLSLSEDSATDKSRDRERERENDKEKEIEKEREREKEKEKEREKGREKERGFLLCGRYRIAAAPAAQSGAWLVAAQSVAHRSLSLGGALSLWAHDESAPASLSPSRVLLKFVKNERVFERETALRRRVPSRCAALLELVDALDARQHRRFAIDSARLLLSRDLCDSTPCCDESERESESESLAEYAFCLVFPRALASLDAVLRVASELRERESGRERDSEGAPGQRTFFLARALASLCDEERSLSLPARDRESESDGVLVRRWAAQLCLSLAALHDAQALHGQLVLSNLLVLRRNNALSLVLSDLGGCVELRRGAPFGDVLACKLSTGVLPPEMFALLDDEQCAQYCQHLLLAQRVAASTATATATSASLLASRSSTVLKNAELLEKDRDRDSEREKGIALDREKTSRKASFRVAPSAPTAVPALPPAVPHSGAGLHHGHPLSHPLLLRARQSGEREKDSQGADREREREREKELHRVWSKDSARTLSVSLSRSLSLSIDCESVADKDKALPRAPSLDAAEKETEREKNLKIERDFERLWRDKLRPVPVCLGQRWAVAAAFLGLPPGLARSVPVLPYAPREAAVQIDCWAAGVALFQLCALSPASPLGGAALRAHSADLAHDALALAYSNPWERLLQLKTFHVELFLAQRAWPGGGAARVSGLGDCATNKRIRESLLALLQPDPRRRERDLRKVALAFEQPNGEGEGEGEGQREGEREGESASFLAGGAHGAAQSSPSRLLEELRRRQAVDTLRRRRETHTACTAAPQQRLPRLGSAGDAESKNCAGDADSASVCSQSLLSVHTLSQDDLDVSFGDIYSSPAPSRPGSVANPVAAYASQKHTSLHMPSTPSDCSPSQPAAFPSQYAKGSKSAQRQSPIAHAMLLSHAEKTRERDSLPTGRAEQSEERDRER